MRAESTHRISIESAVTKINEFALSNFGKVDGCPGTSALKAKGVLKICCAQETDSKLIATWLSPADFLYLGGDPEEDSESQIESWIKGALSSYLLKLKDDPIAFMALEPNSHGPHYLLSNTDFDEPLNIEFGRLIVREEFRRNGYATSLFMHIYKAYLNYRGGLEQDEKDPYEMVLRTDRRNVNCIKFLTTLPLLRIPFEKDGKNIWFKLAKRFQNHAMEVGRFIAKRREEVKFTQRRLAFLVYREGKSHRPLAMKHGLLAMIEAGKRRLRLEDASQMLSVLCKEPIDELEFSARLLGFAFDRSMWAQVESLTGEIHSANQSLWIFSDVLLEKSEDFARESSIRAVLNGHDRYYFVPAEFPVDDRNEICKSFIDNLDRTPIKFKRLEKHVRFYKAPSLLCFLRLAIHVPRSLDAEGLPRPRDAERISIATGDYEKRIQFAATKESLTNKFLTKIAEYIDFADSYPGQMKEGFERIPISWGDLQ